MIDPPKAAPGPPGAATEPTAPGPPRVLVVDDSPAMRQLLSLIAGAKGAEVEEARDGVGALKALSRARFDLVFLDLNMPVMDGHKVIQRIRDDASLAGTRIVVVSTEGADAAVQHALALGADGYLKKPVQRRAVEDVIRGVIQGARPGRAAGRAPAR